jgi:tripartite-type tricarboxylate transporter receptor subunit TctC
MRPLNTVRRATAWLDAAHQRSHRRLAEGDTMTPRCSLFAIPLALALFAGAAQAQPDQAQPDQAQSYPTRPVWLFAPQGPGGPTDLLAHVVAQRLQTALGRRVLVENRGGSGGVAAARAVANARPDGYTLLMGNTSTLVLVPMLSQTMAYDPAKLFTPVAQLAESYQVLVVNPSLPVETVTELIAYARANPGKLNYASTGIGNTNHLSGELFGRGAGVNIVHVPYMTGAEATTAVLNGMVQMTFINVAGVRPLIANGKLRALAVTSAERQALLPEVPTMIESGFPGFVVRPFFGIVAPAGTPPTIVDKLNDTIHAAMTSQEMQTVLKKLDAKAGSGTAAEFASFIADNRTRWLDVLKAANLGVD